MHCDAMQTWIHVLFNTRRIDLAGRNVERSTRVSIYFVHISKPHHRWACMCEHVISGICRSASYGNNNGVEITPKLNTSSIQASIKNALELLTESLNDFPILLQCDSALAQGDSDQDIRPQHSLLGPNYLCRFHLAA